jgi:hypothetical protein
MKLTADGQTSARYYFGKTLEGSHAVLLLNNPQTNKCESHVYTLDAAGRPSQDLGISIDRGGIRITDPHGLPIKVKKVRVYENPAPIGLIGVDGWGRTIVTAYKIDVVDADETFAEARAVDSAFLL